MTETQQLNLFPLNGPAKKELQWTVFLITRKNGRGENCFLNDDEIVEYESNPDLFAAKHFGFECVEVYHEWVEASGAPRCSGRTRSGKLCSNRTGHAADHTVEQWLAHDRLWPCCKHRGAS